MTDNNSNKLKEHFINAASQRIFCKYWYPEILEGESLQAAVFICHGAGEHCQVYGPVADSLTQQKFLVFGHDHVGHGLSEGDRLHINQFSTYTDDVVQHVNIVKAKYPGILCFTVGHSMGGAIAIKTALDHPDVFKGVVLIAPAIQIDPRTATPFKVCLARGVAALLPQCQIGPIEPEWLSRDPEVAKRYEKDPLVWHGGLKARWSVCLIHTMQEIVDRLYEIDWPFLIIHGDQDKLCNLQGSIDMHEQARSTDKTLKIFKGAYHQVHNEIDGQAEESINDIVDWIAKRCVKS